MSEEKKRLHFGDGLMYPTLLGKKQITLRKYRAGAHDFIKDEVVYGEFKDGLDILLKITANTEKKLFSELTDDEAQEDGFENAADAFEGLKSFYPDLQKSDTLAIIRYQIVKMDGFPAVTANQYY